jgi:hypothetical protein
MRNESDSSWFEIPSHIIFASTPMGPNMLHHYIEVLDAALRETYADGISSYIRRGGQCSTVPEPPSLSCDFCGSLVPPDQAWVSERLTACDACHERRKEP